MIGGIVVDIVQRADCQTLEVREQQSTSRCCVDIPLGWCVEFGDAVWWQGGKVYWSPAGTSRRDVPIPKLGYSHRPVDS